MTRDTGAVRHSNNFDLIRLFGALQVVLAHSMVHLGLEPGMPAWLREVIAFFPGVPIFFVVSGYLITASLERSTSLRAYAWNRFLRIYPALWLCFGVTLGMLAVFGQLTPSFLRGTFGPWVAGQLTVLQFYNPAALRGFGVGVVNGSLWTIPVELGFYVMLPAVLLATTHAWRTRRRAASLALAGAAAVSAGLYVWLARAHWPYAKFVDVTPAPHFWMFAYGSLAYLHRDRVLPLVRGRFAAWLAVYLVIALLAPGIGAQNVLTYAPLGAAVLAAAFTRPDLARRVLRGNDISYGVYIYHMLAVNALLHLGYRGQWRFVAITYFATCALASASWWLLERPVLRHKRRATRATVSVTGAAVDAAPVAAPVAGPPADMSLVPRRSAAARSTADR